MTKKWTIPSILVASLLFTGVALVATDSPSIDWWVIGGGGGSASTGSISLSGTIGQAVVGANSNAPYEHCVGFWCGAGARYSVFLPLVMCEE
jgi:hypothetical protein